MRTRMTSAEYKATKASLEKRYRLLQDAYNEAINEFGVDELLIARLADRISDVLRAIDDLETDMALESE